MENEKNTKTNPEKEAEVRQILKNMMESDLKLYEKILDTVGFAYQFNELIKLAMK